MARRLRVVGKKIDFKQWDTVPSVFQEVTGASAIISGGSLGFLSPATILRCRGYVQSAFDETMQAGDTLKLVFGLGIISTDAFTLGTTAFPDPSGEPEYPWLWWGGMHLQAFAAAAVSSWGFSQQRLEVDTKAMRKISPGQSLFWVCEMSGAAGAPVTQLEFGQTRVLIGT